MSKKLGTFTVEEARSVQACLSVCPCHACLNLRRVMLDGHYRFDAIVRWATRFYRRAWNLDPAADSGDP